MKFQSLLIATAISAVLATGSASAMRLETVFGIGGEHILFEFRR